MKSLQQHMIECGEGATTPSTTLGAGNPMAPSDNGGSDPNSRGSGDLFTAKSKRERRKKITNEGLLDADFDIDVDVVASDSAGQWAEKLANFTQAGDANGYIKYLKEMEAEVAATQVQHNKTLMAAFRSKDYTIITFKDVMKMKGRGIFYNAVEIRKFIKNPLPYSICFSTNDSNGGGGPYYETNTKTNHPTQVDVKTSRVYILPKEVWNAMVEVFAKYYPYVRTFIE